MFQRLMVTIIFGAGFSFLANSMAQAQDLGYGNAGSFGPVWAGFYAGGFVGGVRSSEELTGNVNGTGNADGYGAGVYAGGNAQSGNLVVGFEGELSTTIGDMTINGLTTNLENSWAGRARVGVAVNDRALLFFTTGLVNSSIELTAPNNVSSDFDLVGIQAGVGAEALVSSNIFIRADYLYTNYFDEMIPSNFGANTEYDLENHQFRVGLGYKF